MKILKEHINEKFTSDSDPIKDIGIGLNQYKFRAKPYQVENTLNALGDELTEIIVNEFNEHINNIYYIGTISREENHIQARKAKIYTTKENLVSQIEIDNYTEGYEVPVTFQLFETIIGKIGVIHFRGINSPMVCSRYIGDLLVLATMLGWLNVNEKFIENSDPIEDLNIGIKEFWKQAWKKAGDMSSKETSKEYFGTEIYSDEVLMIFMVLDQLRKQIDNNEKPNIKKAFLEMLDNAERWKNLDIIKKDVDLDKVIYVLKKFYYIDIDLEELKIEESLNEKFTEEDSDPIYSLNIGKIREIRDFYEKNSVIPYENWLALQVCIDHNKYEYIKFFIDSEYISRQEKLAGLRYAIFENKLKIVNMFLKAGLQIKDALSKEHLIELRRFYRPNPKILELINKAFPFPFPQKQVNEKFTEESDPIHDMGIGDPLLIAAGKMQKYAEEHGFKFEMKKISGVESPTMIINKEPKFEIITVYPSHFAAYHDKIKYTITYMSHQKPKPFSLRKVWIGSKYNLSDDDYMRMPKSLEKTRKYEEWEIGLLKKAMKKGTIKKDVAVKQNLMGRYATANEVIDRMNKNVKKEAI